MQFAGILPEDAPDPSLERWEQVRSFPLPIVALVDQPSIELLSAPGVSSTSSSVHGVTQREVSLAYTLWRHPEDRDDPRNLADLPERTRRSLDEVPPWPRPAWLIAAAERMRYPSLWEAVKTHWALEPVDVTSALRAHARHILANAFREQLGLGRPPHDRRQPEVSESSVEHGVPVRLDGADVEGVRLDTDPFVFGLGADLGDRGVFTAVIARDELPFLDLAFRSATVDDLMPREPR